ncbi:MAG TPA: GNAT family N-acetyltransferase [Bacteroidales bacterium]|nr:GNAT family N-acetyltransferase [Bacteroidales bacterium]
MIRRAHIKDAEAIAAIYNMAVAVGFCTADTEPQSTEERRQQMEAHSDPVHSYFVFESDGIIAGWASLSPHRPGRKALRFTKEISFYIHPEYQSRGIGSQLLKHTIHFAEKSGIKTLFALLLESNTKSIGLLRKFGFEKWGHLPGVADFEGTEVGQLIFGRRIQ